MGGIFEKCFYKKKEKTYFSAKFRNYLNGIEVILFITPKVPIGVTNAPNVNSHTPTR